MVTYTRRAYERGLTVAVSGNTSARAARGGFWIKRTGACLGEVGPDDFLLVDDDGRVLRGEGAPSKEWRFHAAIYAARPEAGAVFHLHPPYATAYAVAGVLPPLATGAGRGYVRRWAMVPPAPAGSAELAASIGRAFASDPEVRAVLMQGHGAVCAGADARDALWVSEYMEDAARAAWLAGFIGGTAGRAGP